MLLPHSITIKLSFEFDDVTGDGEGGFGFLRAKLGCERVGVDDLTVLEGLVR